MERHTDRVRGAGEIEREDERRRETVSSIIFGLFKR